MKKKFRLLPLVTAAVTAVSAPALPVHSADVTCLSISGGYIAENDIIPVTAAFETRTRTAAYSVTLEFDPGILEFVDAQSCLNKGVFYYKEGDDNAVIVWSNDKDVEVDGALFRARFKARGGTAGKTAAVNIGRCVIGSEEMAEIPYDARNGEISISGNYKWGDANCSGNVNLSDVVAINKYCIVYSYNLSEAGMLNADVDYDNNVNERDAAIVMRYIYTNFLKEDDRDEK